MTTVRPVDELRRRTGRWRGWSPTQVAARTPGHDAVVDLYVLLAGRARIADGARRRAARAPAVAGRWARRVRRVAVGGRAPPTARSSYRTFRPARRRALVEDELVRGVHPMVGRRLDLWRLRDFDITRLPAPEDVLLFDCVAQANPADQRLVAMAQVRQLAVVRDARRPADRPAARRAGGRELPGGDPPHPGRARRGRQPSST